LGRWTVQAWAGTGVDDYGEVDVWIFACSGRNLGKNVFSRDMRKIAYSQYNGSHTPGHGYE
jgi:hypothetical protein